jgi:cation diffusion facilitator CzcD-associated flavoprotein CzcO
MSLSRGVSSGNSGDSGDLGERPETGARLDDLDNLNDFDVVIVGAGLSGIGAAYRLQTECPDKSYAILEARGAIGGTWDLFRYPGVRSDSDMFTLGYPFRPWSGSESIAEGGSILEYINETARDHDIERRIRFGTRITAASWSSDEARWTLDTEVTEDDGTVTQRSLTCSFLYMCSGYYEHGHAPEFEGAEDFGGRIVHPQFWPEDLEYGGKRVAVIGSGATAVTLVPAMARDAEHVTMLQRSPSYISVLPSVDRVADSLRRRLPDRLAYALVRAKNVAFTTAFYQLCRRRPELAKRLLRKGVIGRVEDERQVDEHFTPDYEPWDQRLCIVPGGGEGDLFEALGSERASVVTDHVDRFVPEGIRLASGKVLEADIIVTATGLSMKVLGGISLTVDGRPVDLGETWIHRGVMLSGVPNLALCVGYTNSSWTLRADLSSRYVCRLISFMDRKGYSYGYPSLDEDMDKRPLLDLTSGYVQRAIEAFPKQGTRAPWTMRQNYILDALSMKTADLEKEIKFARANPAPADPAPDATRHASRAAR